MSGDPYGPGSGWWVGSDGQWHSPDEDFNADVPKKTHPVRRVAIVLLVVAVVGATTFGVLLGGGSSGSPSASGPPTSALNEQVQTAVTGNGPNQFGVAGVVSVACGSPSSWTPGSKFTCSVYASSHRKIGVYDGVVDPTSSAGGWSWQGTWHPLVNQLVQ
jgi:hypothetical protein